jgi:signal recognition particle subunit SEC65
MVVTRKPDGFYWYCHRCRKGGSSGIDRLSPMDTIKWAKSLKAKPNTYESVIELPYDFTLELPTEGLAWLYKSEIDETDIAWFGIGYSKKLHRVIIPIYHGNELIYYQGRSLAKEFSVRNPKYMNVWKKGRDDIYHKVTNFQSDAVVVVEDAISSIKVGKVEDTYAVLSAFIKDELLMHLKDKYQTIWLWLDPNKRKHMNDRRMRFRSIGVDVRVMNSSKDPKEYTLEQIENKLEG